jgi:hypothetical protein
MRHGLLSFRGIAALAVGSLVVHNLRYLAGFGDNVVEALASQGHSYMPAIEATALILCLVALARFVRSLARAKRGLAPEKAPPTLTRLWLSSSVALTSIYVAQEGLEGAFSPGHPSGLIGVFGHGGWTALLFAAAIGLYVALLLRGAHRVVVWVATRARRQRFPILRSVLPRRRNADPARLGVVAANLAGRAPPAFS